MGSRLREDDSMGPEDDGIIYLDLPSLIKI